MHLNHLGHRHTAPARRQSIAQSSAGFIYQIARAGLTGEGVQLDPNLSHEIAALRLVSDLPICVGFGISTADHVRQVCAFADGAIVGSAIVRRIAEAVDNGVSRDALIKHVAGFIAELVAGTEAIA